MQAAHLLLRQHQQQQRQQEEEAQQQVTHPQRREPWHLGWHGRRCSATRRAMAVQLRQALPRPHERVTEGQRGGEGFPTEVEQSWLQVPRTLRTLTGIPGQPLGRCTGHPMVVEAAAAAAGGQLTGNGRQDLPAEIFLRVPGGCPETISVRAKSNLQAGMYLKSGREGKEG